MFELEETETRQDYVFRKLQSGVFNLSRISSDTKVSYAVLNRYANRKIKNAGANNIDKLYRFFKTVSE